MTKRIETEEQYQNSLKWLVEKADILAHPLLPDEQREKLMKQYDFVSECVDDYNRRRIAKDHPDMREVFEELGFLPASEEKQQKNLPQKESQPVDTLEKKTQVDLSAWLGEEG